MNLCPHCSQPMQENFVIDKKNDPHGFLIMAATDLSAWAVENEIVDLLHYDTLWTAEKLLHLYQTGELKIP